MARARSIELTCPVKDAEGSPCGEPIRVDAWPGDPGTRWDPPSAPEIYVTEAKQCDHFEILDSMSDEHYEALLEQLEAGDDEEAERERAYEAAQESEIERERERWADLP